MSISKPKGRLTYTRSLLKQLFSARSQGSNVKFLKSNQLNILGMPFPPGMINQSFPPNFFNPFGIPIPSNQSSGPSRE
jgi:hypothetical protein